MKNYFAGLDIGSSKICITIANIDRSSEIQVVGSAIVESKGVKNSIVVDIDTTAAALIECKEKAERIIDLEIDEIYLAVPSSICEMIWSRGVIAITSEYKEITSNDVNRVLDAAKVIKVSLDKEIIGIEPHQFIVDGYGNVKDPISMSGSKLEVEAHVIVAQSAIINNLFKAISKAGIRVKGILLQPLAQGKILLKDDEKENGSAIIDIGADSTSISIFKLGHLAYNETIPIGGRTITNDISLCLKIPSFEAERIKVKYGNLKNLEKESFNKIKVNNNFNDKSEVEENLLNEIILARIEEIFVILKEKIIKMDLFDKISGIIIVGAGSSTNGVSEVARYVLSKPVRIGESTYINDENQDCISAFSVVLNACNDVILNKEVVSESSLEHRSEEKLSYKRKNKNKKNEDYGIFAKVKNFFEDFF